jgi:virginiamycin A acetyltransferase
MTLRAFAKTLVRFAAGIAVAPAIVSFRIRRVFIGGDRAMEGSTQALALVPGLPGQYLRAAFLRWTLRHCDPSAAICFGTIFSSAGSRVDADVYVGPCCHLGLVHLERDVLIGAGVHIPSGPDTHGIADLQTPIREQPGVKRLVRIGAGAWIGSRSVVMADVGQGTVVGAGSIVTSPLPDLVIAAGTPARVLRSRIEVEVHSA